MKPILCLLTIIPLTNGFTLPASISSDVALYSDIVSTSTCSNATDSTCYSSCPARSNFPKLERPLSNLTSVCNTTAVINPPSNANPTNGQVSFDNSTVNCTVTRNYPLPNATKYFTLSFWMNVQCSSKCSIGSVDGLVTFEYSGGNAGTFSVKTGGAVVVANFTLYPGWYSIVVRYNGQIWCYKNGSLIGTLKAVPISTPTASLKLGPTLNLTDGDRIQIIDARWYDDSLTDREVPYVYTSKMSPETLELQTDCRCPASHPELVRDTFPKPYMKCRNGSTVVMRLNPAAHLPVYMIDNDTSTSWKSANVSSVTITVTLKKKVQMKSITLEGVAVKPDRLTIDLYTQLTKRNSLVFADSCSPPGIICFNFTTLDRFSYDLEKSIPRMIRDEYEKILADKIEITFSASTPKQYSVGELKLEARCACYDNDADCKISQGNYNCSCTSTSNTAGIFCEMCKPERYLNTTEETGGFQCNYNCTCNVTGSFNNTCKSINGQCHCKANIEGRQCNNCVHNAADFSSTGCKQCSCNPVGITYCGNNDTCHCKKNVENASSKCQQCLPNFYNITDPAGCQPCECDSSGTMMGKDDTCDAVNGACACRRNVQGRRCDECKDEYFNLSSSNIVDGCEACLCNLAGSKDPTCDKTSGQCNCNDGTSPNQKCVPTIIDVDPLYGPISGGTEITLTGQLLEKVNVSFGGSKQNTIKSNSTVVIIKTSSVQALEKFGMFIVWNSWNTTIGQSFQYKDNPQLVIENAKTYASGGCSVRVTGKYLESVKYPKLIAYLNESTEEHAECIDVSDTSMTCKTPNISEYANNITLEYGVKMDGKTFKGNFKLNIVPDPTIESGQHGIFRNTFEKMLRFKGTRLKDACTDDDVMILLGDKPCNGLKREDNELSCDPGEIFPGTTRTVIVKVKIGNIEVEWGTLEIKSFWAIQEFIYIVIGFSAFVIIIIVIIIVYCCVRRGKCRSQTIKKDESLELKALASDPSHTRRTNDYQFTNPLAISQVAVIQPMEKQRSSKEISEDFCNRLNKSVKKIVNTSLIEKSNIDAGHLCTHKGKLIRVINGQYNSNSSSPYSGMALTIKTLLNPYPEEGNMPDWLNDGLMECTRLRDFTNDNVLRMTGIAVDPKNIYIIYPEMANRTLKDYISRADQELNGEKKLEICVQVAEGMNYLSSQSIVHKDLATRNCWVSRKSEIKIGDSSFSYDLYPEDYLNNNGRYQPVRWMAPECLRQGFYDTKSDVWAYGVLLWEIYTDGYKPYHDIADDRDVQQKVCDEGYRLGKPHECPDKVFELIEECQIQKGADRPNFFIIQNRLDSIVHPGKGLPVSYMNDMELYTNTKDTAAAHVVPDSSNTVPSTQNMEDYENVSQMEVYENLKFKPAS